MSASSICLGHELASGLKIFTSKNVRQNLKSESQFALISNWVSTSVLVDWLSTVLLLTTENLGPNIVADFIEELGKCVADFIVPHMGVYKHNAKRETWRKVHHMGFCLVPSRNGRLVHL